MLNPSGKEMHFKQLQWHTATQPQAVMCRDVSNGHHAQSLSLRIMAAWAACKHEYKGRIIGWRGAHSAERCPAAGRRCGRPAAA